MSWTNPVNPVSGTVITVAYAIANFLEQIRWLRVITGNADPPGSSYVVVSDSASGTTWRKVPSDAIADGAITGPKLGGKAVGTVNIGDQVIGSQQITVTDPFRIANANLGTDVVDTRVLADGAVSTPNLTNGAVGSAQITTTDPFRIANANLGTDVVDGRVLANGAVAAAHTTAGAGSNTQVLSTNGSDWSWQPQSALSVGHAGSADTATNADNATTLGGKTPTATPTANAIPLADASGKLDAWVTPTAAAPVPSGLIAFIADANLPSGWSFYTAANGRVIVAAGSAGVTNWPTFTVGQNAGSSDGAHAHAVNIQHAHSISAQHSHGASGLGVTGATDASSDINGLATAGGVNLNTTGHTHGVGTLDVNGTTDPGTSSGTDNGGSTAAGTSGVVWIPPSHALNAIRKT